MEDLKIILNDLKQVISDSENLAKDDARTYGILLENIRTQVQIKLFSFLLSNNPEYTLLSTTIANKIIELKTELVKLKQTRSGNILEYSSSRERVLERLINTFEDMKKGIDNKDIMNACRSVFDNANLQELVDMCSTSLAEGYMDFTRFYNKDMIKQPDKMYHHNFEVDFDVVEKVTDVIKDRGVHEELLQYAEAVRSFDYEDKIYNKRKETLEILEEAKDYVVELSDIYNSQIAIRNNEHDIKELKSEVKFHNSVLDSFPSRFSRVFNARMISDHDKKRSAALIEMDELEKANKELEEKIVTSVISLGVPSKVSTLARYRGQIVSDHERGSYPRETAYEEAFSDMLLVVQGKEKMNNVLSSAKKNLEKVEHDRKRKEEKKNKLYNELSPEAKKYADEDIYSVKRCIEVLDRKTRYDRTPVICAFMLRAIGDTGKFKSKDQLNEIMSLVSSVDMNELEDFYNSKIQEYVSKQDKEMEELESEYRRMFTDEVEKEIITM